ncbi:hypothetical protein [Vallicoccus soli]|uniref:Uncharacterized protein n=1 Tax=Vallicoccus soli TaxID=2339232 RepID=A0A3A3Z1H9_9ACTN|nr:hypothetical protein [Vallicoccus soli]RJK96367.1 hypothetical protein D5H78_09020 [Vallicoccus soli]
MAVLSATDPVVVDRDAGETDATTVVTYQKQEHEVLWLRPPGGGWDRPNLFLLVGEADAEERGSFAFVLRPGEVLQVVVYRDGLMPSEEVEEQLRAEAYVRVHCLLGRRDLISDRGQQTGGTWHRQSVATHVPTRVVLAAVTPVPPVLGPAGFPVLTAVAEARATRDGTGTLHELVLLPLLPGQHRFCTVVVADDAGDWDVLVTELDTLRRQLTVEFPTLHVYDDGDPGGYGEASFTFQVLHRRAPDPVLLQEFHRPTADIDDWGETARPYALGFAHVGQPQRVRDGEQHVWVASRGLEEDGFLEPDEAAGSWGVRLPLPSGPWEEVTGAQMRLDCPPSSDGSSFHYGVDVRWSVAYVP